MAIADIALDEFCHRKAAIDAACAAGRLSREMGEDILRAWLVIAIKSGCRPGQIAAKTGLDLTPIADGIACDTSAICPPGRWQNELKRALAVALRKSREAGSRGEPAQRYFGLASLALHLGLIEDSAARTGKEAA